MFVQIHITKVLTILEQRKYLSKDVCLVVLSYTVIICTQKLIFASFFCVLGTLGWEEGFLIVPPPPTPNTHTKKKKGLAMAW